MAKCRDVSPAAQTWSKDLERLHESRLASAAERVRPIVWARVGTERPLRASEAVEWLTAQARAQELSGDRVRLYLPPSLLPESHGFSGPERREGRGVLGDAVLGYGLDGYTGGYLRDDLTRPAVSFIPSEADCESVQPLGLVALAALEVVRLTGCTRAEASAWLLCDEPIEGAAIRAYFSAPGGLTLWVPDSELTVEDMARRFSSVRGVWSERQRAKQPEERTGVLIDFVRARRPHKGKHRDNVPWLEILSEWNGTYPAWSYAEDGTGESISKAYIQAVGRRRKLGMLPEGGR